MSEITDIGFIGLGLMGYPMAEKLIGADTRLHVFDTNAETMGRLVAAGALACGSPREVADAASIVFACLPAARISEAVAFGEDGVAGGSRIKYYVETSTIGPDCIKGIAARLAEKGIATVDGPITGGPPAARESRLALMVSGAPEAREKIAPWFSRMGQIYVMGDEVGQGQVMKIVNNLVMATNVVAACEGLVMGAKAGLDADAMTDVLKVGTGGSTALNAIVAPCGLGGTFDFGTRIEILDKDTSLGIAQARALGVPVPVIEAAGAIWHEATYDGDKDRDMVSVLQYVEKHGGAVARSARAKTG